MALSTIALSEGDGAKILATDSVLQGSTTVERQRVVLEGFAGHAYTYAVAVAPTSPTSAGVLLAIENAGTNSTHLFLSRVEIRQTVATAASTLVNLDIGRAAANGTGGGTLTPAALDPDDPTASTRIRYSTAAAPNTGITAPTGTGIIARLPVAFSTTGNASVSASFDGQGKMPMVPLNSTSPITVAISASAATGAPVINLVILELDA